MLPGRHGNSATRSAQAQRGPAAASAGLSASLGLARTLVGLRYNAATRFRIADLIPCPHCTVPMPAGASVCSACGRDRAEDVTLDTPAGKQSVLGTLAPTPISRAGSAPPGQPPSASRPSPASRASRRSSAASQRSGGAGDSLMVAVLPEGTEIGSRYRVV